MAFFFSYDDITYHVLEIVETRSFNIDAEQDGETFDKACGWADLPDDVQINILKELPQAAKVRLRVVCKDWNSLLSDIRVTSYRSPRHENSVMDQNVTEFWFHSIQSDCMFMGEEFTNWDSIDLSRAES